MMRVDRFGSRVKVTSMIDTEDQSESYSTPSNSPTVVDRAEIRNMGKNQISQKTETDMDYSQWQVGPNGKYRAAARTVPHLPAGVYKIEQDDAGPYLQLQNVISDNIVELPGTANVRVLEGMKKFWQRRERYEKFGLVYKRGVLMWGPPGSGKSVTINLLMKELITNDGIVLLCSHPDLLAHMLHRVRQLEPERPIIVVMEDIDELIDRHNEHTILSMLDGENQISNVVYVATTNYPDKLGARIANRPSRFDERVYVPMPKPVARRAYLEHATTVTEDGVQVRGLDDETLDKWTKETEGFSVAHLRELVVSCFCLDQPYEKVLNRMLKMMEKVKSGDGFDSKKRTSFMDDGDNE